MLGHRHIRPNMKSTVTSHESLSEAGEDETMIEDHANEDTGETSAVKSRIQQVKPTDQQIAREACGHYPYRDWCYSFVRGAGRSWCPQIRARSAKRFSLSKHGPRSLHWWTGTNFAKWWTNHHVSHSILGNEDSSWVWFPGPCMSSARVWKITQLPQRRSGLWTDLDTTSWCFDQTMNPRRAHFVTQLATCRKNVLESQQGRRLHQNTIRSLLAAARGLSWVQSARHWYEVCVLLGRTFFLNSERRGRTRYFSKCVSAYVSTQLLSKSHLCSVEESKFVTWKSPWRWCRSQTHFLTTSSWTREDTWDPIFSTVFIEHPWILCQMMKSYENREIHSWQLTCVPSVLILLFRSASNSRNWVVFASEIELSWSEMGACSWFWLRRGHECNTWFITWPFRVWSASCESHVVWCPLWTCQRIVWTNVTQHIWRITRVEKMRFAESLTEHSPFENPRNLHRHRRK